MKILLLAVGILLAGCTTSAQDPDSAGMPDNPRSPEPPAAQFLAGELIVKFEDATPAAEALGGTARGNPAEDPRLTAYIGDLGAELSLPLLVRQVTSGAEVLLALDVPALVDGALRRIRELPGVAEARAVPEPAAVQPSAALSVRFAADSEVAAAAAAGVGATGDERLDALVGGLAAALALPLSYRVAAADRLELVIDLPALTESLAERLRQMPDVRYVELNQLYEPML